ncbi:MAG: hypothetical protein AAF696_11460 [Bacteroidota bacterium]
MRETKSPSYAFLLLQIKDWQRIRMAYPSQEVQRLETLASDLIQEHYGDSFRSILLNSGELFVILQNSLGSKKLVKTSTEIKEKLHVLVSPFLEEAKVSGVLSHRDRNMEVYEVLLYLRKVLGICQTETSAEGLCVA